MEIDANITGNGIPTETDLMIEDNENRCKMEDKLATETNEMKIMTK